jgi:hypothetical protein
MVVWFAVSLADDDLAAWEELRPLWFSLIAVLLLGAVLVYLVDRWRKRLQSERPSAGDQLTSFRALYERGELSREEYERIRNKLGQKLRQELDLPGRPAAPPPAAERPSPPQPPETGIKPE